MFLFFYFLIWFLTDGDITQQTSPSVNAGDDEEGSSDSYSPDGDLIDALYVAQDRSLINCALDTVAKVVIEASFGFILHHSICF